MAAPTEWTYDGQLDWSSADSLRLAPSGLVFRVIIEAVKERYAAIGISAPALLAAEFNPLAPVKTYIDTIQSAMTDLMNCGPWLAFVKHTDSGGDWSGQNIYIIPKWTEADMLAAIGAEERLVLYPLSVLSAEWFFQQYQLLNLLKWTYASYNIKFTEASWACMKKYVETDYFPSEAEAQADAISQYNSADWDESSATTWAAWALVSYRSGDGYKARISVNRWPEIEVVNNTGSAANVICYLRGAGVEGAFYQGIPGIELNKLSLLTDEKYCPPNETTRLSDIITPYYEWEKEFSASVLADAYDYIICKFDVPGGFKFVA